MRIDSARKLTGLLQYPLIEEMVHTRATKDDEEYTDMPTYLQEASAILLSKLEEFTTNSSSSPTEALKRVLDRASELLPIPRDGQASTSNSQTVCRHTCACHGELMHPSRWGNLSKEVLFQIFARLPLSKLVCLQVLSRQWKHEFAEDSTSDFLKTCDEIHPMVALLTRDKENKFWVRLMDVKRNTWHAFQMATGDVQAVDITAASEDGGLVCFISSMKKSKFRTFLVDVVNPLTKHSCALPPLNDLSLVQMLQIIVDPETKLYKVLVVGELISNGTRVAKLYDQSVSPDRWITVKKQKLFVFGYGFHWGNLRYAQKRDSPCAYDFSGKRLRNLKQGSPLENDPNVKNFALQGDRVFVLKKDKDGPNNELHYNRSPVYYIVEYRVRLTPNKEEWVKVKCHLCKPFEIPPKAKYELTLFACQGFLMVLARLSEEDPFRNEVGWLYNLASCRWSDLPNLPGDKPFHVADLMCRLHWNIAV